MEAQGAEVEKKGTKIGGEEKGGTGFLRGGKGRSRGNRGSQKEGLTLHQRAVRGPARGGKMDRFKKKDKDSPRKKNLGMGAHEVRCCARRGGKGA